MSGYPYRAYSPTKGSQSPTRRHPIIPPAGTPIGPRYGAEPGLGDGFEGWYDGTLSYTNAPPANPIITPQSAPIPPLHDIPTSLQAGSHTSSSPRRDYSRDRDVDLTFGTDPTKRASYYSTATSDRGRDAAYRRKVRTPSTSSTEEIARSRSRNRRSSRKDRTPSRSPPPVISSTARDGSTQRTPSGNVMNTIFNAQNAAAVGSALGTAATFLGTQAGIIKNDNQIQDDDYDRTPGSFNSRPVPDTSGANNGFNLGSAVDYLQQFTAPPQTPSAPPPSQQPVGGSPFTLSNALSYLQQQTQQQPTSGTTAGSFPQRFQLAGIDIDLAWIAQKAGEQNPWVLLGGGVVAFWIISSIIATLIWYGIVAGILYVIYIVGVKNGGFSAIGGSPDRRRVGGSGSAWPGAGPPAGRRRY
ncbi:hypothetical protein ABW19_dt0208987 [Dactylella cylindrospora]|nr:hypothetical protein ABW19_dt0208987 [Dactylella cylindrospora]